MSDPKKRRRQRNVKYSDPGRRPMGRPKPLPVGQAVVAVPTRQLRRAAARAASKEKCPRCHLQLLLCECPPIVPVPKSASDLLFEAGE